MCVVDEETRRAIAEFLRERQRRDAVPGVAVAVVEADDEVASLDADDPATWAAGYGARDRAGNRPVTPDTLFGVGAATEPLTAVAVGQLVAAGFCSLDDPVADHVDVSLPTSGAGADSAESDAGAAGDSTDPEPITLRHLLSHTAGLPASGLRAALLARHLRLGGDTRPLATWDDVRAHLAAAWDGEPLASPGERVAHSTAGYVLLGRVVETCTGRSYADYVDEHVLAPLGIERATFDDTAFAMDDNHMTQYLLEDSEPTAASLPAAETLRPATGLLASVRHLAAVARLVLGEGSVAGREVVDPAALEAIGWERRTIAGRTLYGRGGDVAVSGGYLGVVPDAGVGVVVAANAVPEYGVEELGAGVVACRLGRPPTAGAPALARRRRHDRLRGTYTAGDGVWRARVDAEGATLRLAVEGPLRTRGWPLVAVADGDAGAESKPGDDGSDETETTDAERAGRHAFRVGGGETTPARAVFDTTGDRTTLVVGRWRFRRVDPARGGGGE